MPALTLQTLRNALAANLGRVLTPEVAVAIEMAAFDAEDRSHHPEKFGVKHYKDIVFLVERIKDILPELHELHEMHFLETEKHRHGIGLDGNYDYLMEMERKGMGIQFTARQKDSWELVGNIRMYMGESIHTRTLYAYEDTLYLRPEYRKGLTAVRFMQYVEDCLKFIGVREVRTDSKTINKAHRLVEYLGYKHVANKYVKIVSE
jgi:GNAT superfamily N-acetyltransferase